MVPELVPGVILGCVRPCKPHASVEAPTGPTDARMRARPSPPRFPPNYLRSGGSGFSVTSVNAAGSGTEALPPTRKPYVLALFCGTAGVSAAMQKRGCDVLGMDHKLKPRCMKASAVRVELRCGK